MIPIYRAKKIDSDEWVEGYYDSINNKIVRKGLHTLTESYYIDPSTLAIHFPTMIDKNGKKIFASLNMNYGVGGDNVYAMYEWEIGEDKWYGNGTIKFYNGSVMFFHETSTDFGLLTGLDELEVIGIHKG